MDNLVSVVGKTRAPLVDLVQGSKLDIVMVFTKIIIRIRNFQ